MSFRETLPAIYQGLIPDELFERSAEVKKATCGNCFMADPLRGGGHYKPSLKCCTYYPFIPNYLVGAILQAGGPGAEKLTELIERRQYCLPIGVVPPPSYRKVVRGRYFEIFGRDPSYICPFYVWQGGLCGIWKHRGSQCTTFFCVQDEEGPKESDWDNLREGLHYLELALSQRCMVEKGYTHKEVEGQLFLLSDRAFDQAQPEHSLSYLDWQKYWVHHVDDVPGFYLACLEKVQHKGQEYLAEDEIWTQDKLKLFKNFPSSRIGKTDTNASLK